MMLALILFQENNIMNISYNLVTLMSAFDFNLDTLKNYLQLMSLIVPKQFLKTLLNNKKRNSSQNYSRISSIRKPYTNLPMISHHISARLKKRSSKL